MLEEDVEFAHAHMQSKCGVASLVKDLLTRELLFTITQKRLSRPKL